MYFVFAYNETLTKIASQREILFELHSQESYK